MQGTRAIARAAEILRAVARLQRSGATLAAMTKETNLTRSTTFRILRALCDERLVSYDAETHRYGVGPLAYELGLAAQGQAPLLVHWRERLDRLALLTGLTAYLVIRSDCEVACLATAQGNSVIRAVPLAVGQRLPLGVGAGSLAILSSLPDPEIDTVLALNAHKLALHGEGKLTPECLWERVRLTRKRGYAFSKGSVSRGVLGIGIDVSPEGGLTHFAVSVSMPETELADREQARLAQAIRDVAGL